MMLSPVMRYGPLLLQTIAVSFSSLIDYLQ
jgi:hypothetical protein